MPRPPFFILLCFLAACHQNPTQPRRTDTAAPLLPQKTQPLYFPANIFEDSDKTFHYSSTLSLLHEPILYQNNRPVEIYRFTHTPRLVSIRFEKEDNKIMLYWKTRESKLTADSLQLSDKEWQEWLHLLKNADFWNMPTNSNRIGDDGGQYILEGKSAGRYHVVDRWTPEGGPYLDCCGYLLRLAKLIK